MWKHIAVYATFVIMIFSPNIKYMHTRIRGLTVSLFLSFNDRLTMLFEGKQSMRHTVPINYLGGKKCKTFS